MFLESPPFDSLRFVNEKDAAAAAATPETSVGEAKTNLAVSFGSSSSDAQPKPAMPFMPGSVFHANPCDFFLSMAGLLNQPFNHLHKRLFGLKQEFGGVASSNALSMVWLHDPRIKDIAKQIEKDPSFNKMAEQFRQTFHGGDDGVRQFDVKRQYFLTMEQQVMRNPQLMKMAKSLGTFIMQNPSVSQMLESLSNPAKKEQLEVRMARIKENPSLKPILEEIESGGPTAMMRYWNDEEVLKKVGEAMGLAVTEDATASAGHTVAYIRKKVQQLDEEVKATKAELMSKQKQQQQQQLKEEEEVKAKKAKLTSIQEESHQFDIMDCEAARAEFMRILEQYHQHNEQSEALKARLIAAMEQRIAAMEPMIAAVEQAITMANDRTEPVRARVGVSVAVTIGVFSHVYR
ncbi:hypothetical protein Hanom_Chr10g00922491 [Helianthus anomalus]